jgi:hypothetical protein
MTGKDSLKEVVSTKLILKQTNKYSIRMSKKVKILKLTLPWL